MTKYQKLIFVFGLAIGFLLLVVLEDFQREINQLKKDVAALSPAHPTHTQPSYETYKTAHIPALQTVNRHVYKPKKCLSANACYQLDVSIDEVNDLETNEIMLKIANANITGNSQEVLSVKSIHYLEESWKSRLQEDMEMFGDEATFNFEYLYKQDYLGQYGYLATFSTLTSQLTGGAHGIHFLKYYLVDLVSKKQIDINDILLDDPNVLWILESELRDGYRQLLRNQYEQNDEEIAEFEAFWQEGLETAFKKPDNFYFDVQGVHFVFNPYEIGPYAFGVMDIFIPYEKAVSFLKPMYLRQVKN